MEMTNNKRIREQKNAKRTYRICDFCLQTTKQ